MGGPGSVHKLPRVLIMFCILRRIYRLCMRNSRYSYLSIETQAYHGKYRNKFHFPKTSCPFFLLSILLYLIRTLSVATLVSVLTDLTVFPVLFGIINGAEGFQIFRI